MGTENPVTEVEDRVPGLRFSVKTATRSARAGMVVLHCVVDDVALWDRVVERLDGLKLFSTMSEEIVDALGEELTAKVNEVSEYKACIEALQAEVAEQLEKNQRLQGLLSNVGLNLGLT